MWVVETIGPPPFNRKNLYTSVLWCCRQAGAVVGTFLGGSRLPATAGVIFHQRLEVIVYFLFLRELCF